MTPEQLEEIEKRANAATPGPWSVYGPGMEILAPQATTVIRSFLLTVGEYRQEEKNARFIAHAREDIPTLIAEVKRLMEINEENRKVMLRHKLLIELPIESEK